MNLDRIRIGCSMTALIGVMYASASLFDSLAQVGLGAVIAGIAVIGYGLCDYLDAHRDDRTRRARDAVWARRDAEAARIIERDTEAA